MKDEKKSVGEMCKKGTEPFSNGESSNIGGD